MIALQSVHWRWRPHAQCRSNRKPLMQRSKVRQWTEIKKWGRFPKSPGHRSWSGNPLKTEGETDRHGAVNPSIVDVGVGEQFFERRLEPPIRHVFLRKKTAATRVGLDRAQILAKLLVK